MNRALVYGTLTACLALVYASLLSSLSRPSQLLLSSDGLTIGLIGPGQYALDALFGIVLPEALLFGILVVAALLVDIVGIIISSRNVVVAQPENASRAS